MNKQLLSISPIIFLFTIFTIYSQDSKPSSNTNQPVISKKITVNQKSNAKEIDGYLKLDEHIIKDKKTGYLWYIAPDKSFSFNEALFYSDNLYINNFKWRIPTYKEIHTLFNSNYTAGTGFYIGGKNYPAKIHSVFNAVGQGAWFWVTDAATNAQKGYAANLFEGIRVPFNKNNPKYPVHLMLISK